MAKIFFPLKQNEEEARVVFPITHITDLAGPGVRPQHTVSQGLSHDSPFSKI